MNRTAHKDYRDRKDRKDQIRFVSVEFLFLYKQLCVAKVGAVQRPTNPDPAEGIINNAMLFCLAIDLFGLGPLVSLTLESTSGQIDWSRLTSGLSVIHPWKRQTDPSRTRIHADGRSSCTCE